MGGYASGEVTVIVDAPKTETVRMETGSKCVTLNAQNFRPVVLEARVPVLVDFWAPWCAPCRAIAPAIEELAVRFEGRVTVAKVNVDEQPELAVRYAVRSIPTLAFFCDGQLVDQAVGMVPTPLLAQGLERLIGARPHDRGSSVDLPRGAA